MAKAKKQKHALKTLVILLIVLAAITALCFGGIYFLTKEMKTADADAKEAALKQTEQIMNTWQQQCDEIMQANQQMGAVEKPQPVSQGWDVVDMSSFPVENPVNVSFTRDQLLQCGGILVNYWHPIPQDLPEDQLESVQTRLEKRWQTSGTNVKMFPAAVDALDRMLTAAKADGLENYIIESGYRTMEDQQAAWDKEAAGNSYKNYSGEALNIRVNKVVSMPGTSEYQSGFACCIQRYKAGDKEFNRTFAGTEHSEWLLEHGWEYGFVFRYPIEGYPAADTVDKSWITGRNNKLSIYRYVGNGNAAVMHQKDWCMEEYYEYLSSHPHLMVYENGKLRYEIVRARYDGGDTVTVTAGNNCRSCEASMDNIGGVIVVMSY